MNYILDTDAWIAVLRWQNAGVLDRLKQTTPQCILLCSVVLAELWFGVEKSDPGRRAGNRQLIEELEASYASLAFDNDAARAYASIRAHLSSLGQLIGPNDLLIAAIARSHGATLITHNTTEFSRVPGLLVEDWQSA